MAIPKKVLKVVQERDSHCWHCGSDQDLVPHHRINRGMGGSKLLDRPNNLIMVCALYNGLMESDADTARRARSHGHKLAVWETLDRPCFDVATGWWYLMQNGFRIPVPINNYFESSDGGATQHGTDDRGRPSL